MVDGAVFDETGKAVDWAEAWDDGGDSAVCGLRILKQTSEHEDAEEEGGPGWVQSRGFRLELGIPIHSSARSVKTRCIIRVEVRPIL